MKKLYTKEFSMDSLDKSGDGMQTLFCQENIVCNQNRGLSICSCVVNVDNFDILCNVQNCLFVAHSAQHMTLTLTLSGNEMPQVLK
jgi:hypothetical protein